MSSPAWTQTARPVQITTPLSSTLLVRSFEGEEQLSGLFHYKVEMASSDAALDFTSIVGKSVTLTMQQASGDTHYVNGVVGQFRQSGCDEEFAYYTADIYPWLWMLTMSSNCAVYQNLSTPDIVKKVFSDLGFTDFTDKLTGSYQPREYCVQYRETAFAFVSRLMEQEGIFYFFTHDASSHKLVLADDSTAWTTLIGLTSARYTTDQNAWTSEDVISECEIEQSVTSGKFATDDYNFETPDTDLKASAEGPDTTRSVFEYPGVYAKQTDGETIASRRLSALELPGSILRGAGRCRAFYAGGKFTLSGHYRDTANTDYVIRTLKVAGDQEHYSNSFEAFPASAAYRPPVTTPAPVIPGTQPAVVVGKAGEEIWTDQYGRVKVQFFWDQVGTNDENSSCWIRVSQPWAGKLWGGIFLPRIGQEVIVAFLDGNPDRPVVVGSLYNASQTVPYTLPDEQTKSTIKSSSSKGGSGFNEIRLEDKAGSEEVYIHAQHDMTVDVSNKLSTTVMKNEVHKVLGLRNMNVSGDENHGNEGDYISEVKGKLDAKVNGNETHTIQGDYSSTVSGNFTLKVSGNLSIDVSGSVSIKAGSSFANQAGTSLSNKSGTDLTNDAGTTLTNKAAASQTVDGGGMLTVKGGLVKIN
ncbi:MAG TPA: type VI secretion system tip protein TssI/VgrG [Bryobacteraceae bacterium]|jgi:type VI secretion system secreted protein VgrG|nr:type VI secretion system tip protein TssI/VgrG [Bryobacteraceae bacterium]